MEITIKTLGEARDQRVTVEINGARLYTAAEVGDAQASEVELVAAPLRRRIAELEGALARSINREGQARTLNMGALRREADRLAERNAELESELEKIRTALAGTAGRAEGLADRVADLNGELARTKARLTTAEMDYAECRRMLADAQRAIDVLSGQLGRVSGAVHSSELVHGALRRDWTSWSEREAAALTSAIHFVRDALGSPSLPERASEPTSQA